MEHSLVYKKLGYKQKYIDIKVAIHIKPNREINNIDVLTETYSEFENQLKEKIFEFGRWKPTKVIKENTIKSRVITLRFH